MASSNSSHKSSFTEYEKAPSTASKEPYDVFINHRGPDVKGTVAYSIYDSLKKNGFRSFLDLQELELGDAIEPAIKNAINTATVQIAIFSRRYAESCWSLSELVHMHKTGAYFIPVFCDVKPSDVRYPHKGVFRRAFAQHEKKGRFGNEIQEWKDALHYSSGFCGYEFLTSKDNVERLSTEISLAVQKLVGNSTSSGFPRDAEASKDQICVRAESAASTSTSAQGNKNSSLLPRNLHPEVHDLSPGSRVLLPTQSLGSGALTIGRGRGRSGSPTIRRGRGGSEAPTIGRGRGRSGSPTIRRGRGGSGAPTIGRGRGGWGTISMFQL